MAYSQKNNGVMINIKQIFSIAIKSFFFSIIIIFIVSLISFIVNYLKFKDTFDYFEFKNGLFYLDGKLQGIPYFSRMNFIIFLVVLYYLYRKNKK